MKGRFIMTRFVIAIVIIAAFYLNGCQAMGLMPEQPGDLTPEQIKAYSDAGSKVYKCFTLAGPPPAGGVGAVILPKEDKSTVKFLPGCHISMQ